MTETCPHLAYREEGDGASFETARAFCTARYALDPATDCEFYVEPEPDESERLDADR